MRFEEFDKKIKEASDHYHPAYDETAWKKMNDLLDDELPEKKNDWRRIYYFLFLLIFITTGGYLLIEKPWNSNNKTFSSNNNSSTKLNPANSATTQKEVITGKSSTEKKYELGKGSESIPAKKTNLIPLTTNITSGKDLNSFNNTNRVPSKIYKNKFNTGIENKNSYSITKERIPDVGANDKNDIGQQKPKDIIVGNTLSAGTKDISDNGTKDISDNGTKDISDNKNDIKQPTAEPPASVTLPPKKNKKQKRFVNSLGFTISAGPDKSSILSAQPGKTTLYFGAGLRYDISKRITVKTGFYITDKIYSAAGKDYKQTYNYYPTFTLTSVDADCKIFEVPLIVSYNFIQRKKINLFGSIGTSSLFMKREIYQYHYNNTWGQYRYGTYTYNNKNKHYFSVVTLSAGYERNLSPLFSLIAEPYVKLPLSGIGAGKIKLNSAGLLVSVSVKPFAAKEKKK